MIIKLRHAVRGERDPARDYQTTDSFMSDFIGQERPLYLMFLLGHYEATLSSPYITKLFIALRVKYKDTQESTTGLVTQCSSVREQK